MVREYVNIDVGVVFRISACVGGLVAPRIFRARASSKAGKRYLRRMTRRGRKNLLHYDARGHSRLNEAAVFTPLHTLRPPAW